MKKSQTKNKPIYYNVNKVFSYNAIFNVVITSRGKGKTFGFMKKLTSLGYFKNRKYLLLVKFASDIKDYTQGMIKLLNEIVETFDYLNNLTITLAYANDKGGSILINEKEVFRVQAISQSEKLKKQVDLKYFNGIFHDEFMTLGLYVPKEVSQLLTIYETMCRRKTGRHAPRLWLASNSLSLHNPYFKELEIKPTNEYTYDSYRSLLVHIDKDDDYVTERLDSVVNRLASKTEYVMMSVKNNFILDNDYLIDDNIHKKSKILMKLKCDDDLVLLVNKNKYQLRYLFDDELVERYVHNRIVTDDSILIPKNTINNLRKHFYSGNITFTNVDVKNQFINHYIKS